jgi:hypothetical protein
MSENEQLVCKPINYYFLDLTKVSTLEDLTLLVQAVFEGVRLSDDHPLFEQLKEKGFILDAPQI